MPPRAPVAGAQPGDRLRSHAELGTALALLSDTRLAELIAAAPVLHTGIGGDSVLLELDGRQVFVKRVPLTDTERRPEHVRCTANVFGLSPALHYGIGSVGHGGWRELAAHLMASNRVLAGHAAHFPLLHHWRVLPGRPRVRYTVDERDTMVAFWDATPAVAHRLDELLGASASVVLCCEYLPQTVHDWLTDRVADGTVDDACARLEPQLLALAADLTDQGLLHFDTHFRNILTDGERIYLGDFGLATATRFELSATESAFVRRHRDHDACYLVAHLLAWLVTALAGATDRPRRTAVLRAAMHGELPALPPGVSALVRRYAPVAVVLDEFYGRLYTESRGAPYPAAELAAARARSGLPVAPG